MKNKIYSILMIFAIALALYSCDKNKTPEPEDSAAELLVNTEWLVSNVYINGDLDEQSDYSQSSIKFDDEENYTFTHIDGTVETGSYSLNSEAKSVALKDENWDIITLDKNELVIEFVEESEKMGEVTIKIEFVKS